MKSFEDYLKTQLGAILLLGDPGVGKTTLLTQLPNPYIIECDANLLGPISTINKLGLKKDFRYDIPHIDDNGNPVPRKDRYKRFAKLASDAVSDPWTKTIGIDSLTTWQWYIEDEVRVQQGRKMSNGTTQLVDEPLALQDWRPFAMLAKEIIMALKATGKLIVFIGHIDARTDENSNISGKDAPLMKYINFPGSLRQTMGGLFDDVWLMATERKTVGGVLKSIRTIQTGSDSILDAPLGLKNARGLGHKFDLNFDELTKTFL